MIVKMCRLDLLLYHREKEALLKELQDFGVVHIVENADKDSTSLQKTADSVKRCEHALAVLAGVVPQSRQAEDLDGTAVLEHFESLEASLHQLLHSLQQSVKDEAALHPWGEFDPGLIKKLAACGIRILFFKTEPHKFSALDREAFVIEPVLRLPDMVYFIVVTRNDQISIDALELFPPCRSLHDIRADIDSLKTKIAAVQADIGDITRHREVLAAYCQRQQNLLSLLSAALDTKEQAGGALINLTGWLPAEKEKSLREFLSHFSAWYCFSDPSPEDDVPVLLKNNSFIRLFEPITRLFSLPVYTELDPTPFFAPFFALYVGLCMADMGYGAIILCAAASAFVYGAINYRPYFKLLMVLGGATMLGGMLLNSFFGAPFFGGPGVPGGIIHWGATYFSLLTPLPGPRGTVFPMMSFALLLGFLQVMLALFLRSINCMRTSGFVSCLQPVSYMLCICGSIIWIAHTNFLKLNVVDFTIGSAKLGLLIVAVPLAAGKVLTWGGLVLLFCFNNPDKNIGIRLPLGIWELYGFVTGIFGDILSYLRLFALGLSGGLLGASFNKIAFMPVTRDDVVHYGSPLIAVTILLLIIGHLLNLILSIIGAFVHPLRLTFVEFYKNLDFKGGGKPYTPFSKLK
jgi:V/A-type H+/Na+-transporting ATPase subunit I